jgi:LPXTG-site transpeptidase (sortase) family protein
MNAGEANTLANYTLVKDPATPVNVDTAAYGVPSKTTTLGINGGVALSEGKYTLTVKNTLHDSLGYALSADFVRVFWIDKTGIQVLTNGVALPDHTLVFDGATLNTSVTEIWVQFNEDAANPAGDADPEDVTNPANYLLVRPGPNGIVDTLTCLAGLQGDDLAVPTGPVTYDNGGGVGPDLAKVRINNGTPLENGIYKLLICGTTSVTDLAGNHLNNGADQALNFTVLVLPSSSSSKASGTSRGKALTNPNTGFEPGVFTVLPAQPTEKAYADLGSLQIEIPALNLKTSIAGVPLSSQGWDLTWLAKQVGWLQGTAFPTWEGNSVLTAHSYTSDGLPGPFARLKDLHYDDLIIIRFGGLKYTYAVRNMYLVTSADTQWVTRSEKRAWLTLITCQQFDDRTKSYLYRDIARAVLLKVETER